jgi:diketogulonate reductase-like aldo/keto reductase
VGAAVAAAIAAGHVARADLFLQTKFTSRGGQDHRLPYDAGADAATQVAQSFASSLEHLRTDYVDSYVLHGPSSGRGLTAHDWASWRAMEELHRSRRARLLGISNVSLEQLTTLCDGAEVTPAFVQNRCFAATGWDLQVRRACVERGILYPGFSLLTANQRELASPRVHAVARHHGWTLPQVVFTFALQVGMVPLTGTTRAAHMREDLASVALEREPAEVDALERCGLREA